MVSTVASLKIRKGPGTQAWQLQNEECRMTSADLFTEISNAHLERFFADRLALFLAPFLAPLFAAFFAAFLGTFAPFFLASDRPMAIACLRLVTVRPLPLFNLPRFFLCMAFFTVLPADLEYLAIVVSFKRTFCKKLVPPRGSAAVRSLSVKEPYSARSIQRTPDHPERVQ